jgi:hypothetical protein
MVTGRVPWQAQSEDELKRKLRTPPAISRQINSRVREILLKCLAMEAGERPTCESLEGAILDILKSEENREKAVNSNNG